MIKKNIVFILIIILISSILSACGQKELANSKNWPVRDFTHIDQEGKEFGLSDLEGKVWVSDFVFTTCADVCLPMTKHMSELQDMLKDEGIKDVEFVSFSVDPTVDTPERLKMFAEHFGADFSNWHLLTGYSQEYIEEFARDDFKSVVIKPEDDDQVIHETFFFLVNQKGLIVNYYDGLEKENLKQIIKDIKTIQ